MEAVPAADLIPRLTGRHGAAIYTATLQVTTHPGCPPRPKFKSPLLRNLFSASCSMKAASASRTVADGLCPQQGQLSSPVTQKGHPSQTIQIGLLVHVQVPLEGVIQKGGVAAVLAAPGDLWVGRQETGEPRCDFFISTRQVGSGKKALACSRPTRGRAAICGDLVVCEMVGAGFTILPY